MLTLLKRRTPWMLAAAVAMTLGVSACVGGGDGDGDGDDGDDLTSGATAQYDT